MVSLFRPYFGACMFRQKRIINDLLLFSPPWGRICVCPLSHATGTRLHQSSIVVFNQRMNCGLKQKNLLHLFKMLFFSPRHFYEYVVAAWKAGKWKALRKICPILPWSDPWNSVHMWMTMTRAFILFDSIFLISLRKASIDWSRLSQLARAHR